MADLKTNLLGFVMNSPVIGASGTVGYGVEYEELADFAKIGGISGKGLTLHGQTAQQQKIALQIPQTARLWFISQQPARNITVRAVVP